MEGVKEMRQFARLQLAIVGLSVLVGLLLGAGGGGSEKVVRATRFEVVDEKGRVVGTFGAGADGVVLGIMDRTSRKGAMLGTRPDGSAFVAVADAAGHPEAAMVAPAGEAPVVVVTGKDGKPAWSAP
jgi:hypothetical protein